MRFHAFILCIFVAIIVVCHARGTLADENAVVPLIEGDALIDLAATPAIKPTAATKTKSVVQKHPVSATGANKADGQDDEAKLTPEEHKKKYERFLAVNKKKRSDAGFKKFVANRERIVAANKKAKRKVFRSDGPFADLSPEEFKAKFLNTRNPRKKKKGPQPWVPPGGVSSVKVASKTKSKRLYRIRDQLLSPEVDPQVQALIEASAEAVTEIESEQKPWTPPQNGGGGTVGAAGGTAGRGGFSAGTGGGQAGRGGFSAGTGGGQAGRGGFSAGTGGGQAGRGGFSAGTGGGEAGRGGFSAGTGGAGAGRGGFSAGTGGAQSGRGGFSAGGGSGLGVAGAQSSNSKARPDPYTLTRPVKIVSNFPADTLITSNDQIKASLFAVGITPDQFTSVARNMQTMSQVRGFFFSKIDVPIVPQGECQSCWAHTASRALQTVHARSFNYQQVMTPSPQQAIDCVKTELTKGCVGGTPMDALDYWASTRMATAKQYAFTGSQGTCQTDSIRQLAAPTFKSWGWRHSIPPCDDELCRKQPFFEVMLMMRLMNQPGIVSVINPIVYVDATNWQSYKGGLFPTDQCKSTMEASNHVVHLVGFGPEPKTGVFSWIALNSWGNNWGSDGRIYLPFGVNACGIANYVIEPTPPDEYVNRELRRPFKWP